MADLSSRPFQMPRAESPADRLLEKTLDHILGAGDPTESLRSIAEAIGTSHRMLQYHFGSKERLLAGVFFKYQQRLAVTNGVPLLDPTSRAHYVRMSWDIYREPDNFVMLELLLMITNPAAGALNDLSLMTSISGPWSETLVELGLAEGLSRERAESEARLVRNAWRGLHADLYGTGDTVAADAALEVLLEWISPPE
jgi:AcrR family transcriptional regulator